MAAAAKESLAAAKETTAVTSSSAAGDWVDQKASAAVHAHDMSVDRMYEGGRPMDTSSSSMMMSGHEDVSGMSAEAVGLNEDRPAAAAVAQHDESLGEGTGASSDADDASSDAQPCPLFMAGLPRDFSSNPGLAAIASLLGETVDESDGDENNGARPKSKHKSGSAKGAGGNNGSRAASINPRAGGGKVGGAARRKGGGRNKRSVSSSGASSLATKRSCHRPYPTADEKKTTSVGEAQLYLNMWKL